MKIMSLITEPRFYKTIEHNEQDEQYLKINKRLNTANRLGELIEENEQKWKQNKYNKTKP